MTPLEKLASHLKIAAETGLYSGLVETPQDAAYLRRCTMQHIPGGVSIMFSRDTGHHTSGWWKNPDYERCYHLSIAFADFAAGEWLPFDTQRATRIARLFFGNDLNLVWVEPPYTPEGRAKGVHHYRLFCDAGWHPIKPRGEVYSNDWTPGNWRSFGEIHGDKAKQYAPPICPA